MFSTDNSGVFWGLTSLVIIVFVGIGLSSLTQRRFEFSSNNKDSNLVIQSDAALLRDLAGQKERLEATLARTDGPGNSGAANAPDPLETIRSQRTEIETLQASLDAGKAAYVRVEDAFSAYRASYRNQTWIAAGGEKFPVIQLRSGRQYQNASIIKVTLVGLEISYADGKARINSAELDDTWQQRFQWNEAEREAALDEEQRIRNRHTSDPQPTTGPAAAPKLARNEEPGSPSKEEIQKCRTDLSGWNYKVSQLDAQYSEAKTKSGQGSPSVPGSLETWVARAGRLGGDLERARGNQLRAKARLAMIAPNDPLLFPQ